MENDVLDICVSLVSGGEQGRANLTSGGTESNFCGLHAMRAWAREHKPEISQPEILAPYSTHSTVHKTAKYLDLKLITIPQKPDLSADLDALAAAIDARVAARKGTIKTPAYAVKLAEEFRSTLLDYQGADAGKKCARFTIAWVRMGGSQDELVGECRMEVKILRQRAGIVMALDPRMREITRAIRLRSRRVLRGAAQHEGARH